MKRHILQLSFLAALAFTSCKQEEFSAPTSSISDVEAAQIQAMGFSSDKAIKEKDGYIVEGDIFIKAEDLGKKEAIQTLRVGEEEQYRTTNIVTGVPRNLTVSVTSTAAAYFHNAAQIAIDRYNAVSGLQLSFTKVTGTANINIVIYYENSNVLGSAGFPSNGNPYNQIRMNSYHYSASTNLNYLASIMTHEMGHCIGFRHTDYMNRSYSCGFSFPNNEGASSYGAIHIPGTPKKGDPNSWMLACSNGSDRPFNANDITALQYVY